MAPIQEFDKNAKVKEELPLLFLVWVVRFAPLHTFFKVMEAGFNILK